MNNSYSNFKSFLSFPEKLESHSESLFNSKTIVIDIRIWLSYQKSQYFLLMTSCCLQSSRKMKINRWIEDLFRKRVVYAVIFKIKQNWNNDNAWYPFVQFTHDSRLARVSIRSIQYFCCQIQDEWAEILSFFSITSKNK